MTFTFKLSRRIARLRAPLFATLMLSLVACNQTDSFNPDNSSPAEAVDQSPALASATSYSGIPIGLFALPIDQLGSRYNGAKVNLAPSNLLRDLARIKASGGRVILAFGGHEDYFKDAAGHFVLSKWKVQIDRYKGINFSSYINDGTVIGHYVIDEPYDPANWGGQPIPGSMVDEMAKYSKSLWPDMATIVRAESYMIGSGPFRYLDAAWAQYLDRKGDVRTYLARNIADAQNKGLALIVGLNAIKGSPSNGMMTASQIKEYGSALLSSSYPCAFITYQYRDGIYSSTSMQDAMDALRRLANAKSLKNCRGSSGGTVPPPPPPPPPGTPPPPPPPASFSGVPFGPYAVPTSAMSSFSGAVRSVTPSGVLATATAARQAGARIVLRLTGAEVANANGTFSLTKWKAAIDRYAGVNLSSVNDGTIAGHLLVVNPQDPGSWGGQRISYDTLEEMARYSRQRWPWLPTIAQAPPSWLAGKPTSWVYLDAASVMYNGSAGEAGAWIGEHATAAGRARLGLLVGMNVLNGGTSTSRLAGTEPGHYAMSASQLQSWGSTLVAQSQVCGLVMARYDATYFGRSDVKTAIAAVATKARAHSTISCRVR